MEVIIQTKNGTTTPAMMCEHCHLPITSADAVAKWPDVESSYIFVCHKGECDRLSGGIGAERWPWMPLSSLLVYLTRNLELDWGRENERADMLGSI